MRLTLLGLLVLGCGGSSDLCGRLGSAPSCSSDATQQCSDAISREKASDPTCEPQLSALVSCIAPLELSCTGPGSIAAVGDGHFASGQNFIAIGGDDVVVNDSRCDVDRRGLEACRTCPDAVGAMTPGVLGIGDACPGAVSCAAGLSCRSGICTRSCSSDDDCKARADGCQLQAQFGNVCASGTCTRGCSDDFACEAELNASSRCVQGACTL